MRWVTSVLMVFTALQTVPTFAQSSAACGQLITLATHDATQTRYSLAGPSENAKAALVIMAGGAGFLDLDNRGCPQRLAGNSLVWSIKQFHGHGLLTALVDAPSDYQDRDGLAGFRIAPKHAADLGKVIADLRRRTKLPIWLAGTSRGAISAANAATRLTGADAPDGVILTSAVTQGREGAQKLWVAQSVFSTELQNIKLPILVIAHEDDKCVRTPPYLAERIVKKTKATRSQTVMVTGGPGWGGPESVKACRGKAPHGFVRQRSRVNAGIARFINGGRY